MFRVSIWIVATIALLFVNLIYTAQARVYRNQAQNAAKCHQKIDPKKLNGDARKNEWGKCMENPDNYN